MNIPFQGKKTYIIAACLVLYGVFGAVTGKLDGAVALTTILEGLAFAGLRLAVK